MRIRRRRERAFAIAAVVIFVAAPRPRSISRFHQLTEPSDLLFEPRLPKPLGLLRILGKIDLHFCFRFVQRLAGIVQQANGLLILGEGKPSTGNVWIELDDLLAKRNRLLVSSGSLQRECRHASGVFPLFALGLGCRAIVAPCANARQQGCETGRWSFGLLRLRATPWLDATQSGDAPHHGISQVNGSVCRYATFTPGQFQAFRDRRCQFLGCGDLKEMEGSIRRPIARSH